MVLLGTAGRLFAHRQKVFHLQQLSLRDERYRLLRQAAGDPFFFIGTDGRILEANRAAEETYGYGPREMEGLLLNEILPPSAREEASVPLRRALEGGARFKTLHLKKDGTPFPVEVTSRPATLGGQTLIVTSVRDVTERKRAEEALSSERDFTAALLESLPGVVYCFDEKLRFRRWNRNFEAVTGYTAEEISRLGPLDFFADSDKDLLARRIGEVFERGESSVEADFLTKDGRRIPYFFTGVSTSIGGRVHLVGMGVDLSALRRAETETRQLNERLRSLMEAAHEGIWALDAEGRTTYVNRRMVEMLGAGGEAEVLGRSFLDFVEAEDREEAQRVWGERKEGRGGRREIRLRRQDGSLLPVYASVAPIFDEKGRFAGVVGLNLDLSERKKMEAELEQARMLETAGLIAGGVAHEVRNPLFALQTVAAALERKLGDREDLSEFFGHMKDQVDRLNALMTDLLHLGRPIESADFAEVDLLEVVGSAVRNLAPRVPGIEEKVRVEGEAPPLRGARLRLLQVAENLLSNALSFTPEGEAVAVTLRREGPEVVWEVRDRGPGIPEELLNRLFTPFASRRKGGTGLGLAIVQKIVKAHGGVVEAKNNDPPPGATFAVRLPAP